jgi:hypothetical protein
MQQQVDKLYENLGLTAMSLTSFGPFSSLEEALAWQEEMRDKVSDCTVLEPIRADNELLPWYGFSYKK